MSSSNAHPRRARTLLQSLPIVPSAVLPLLPKATCPICVAAYAGTLSALGLGFLAEERVLAPLIGAFLVVTIATVAWGVRSHHRLGPLIAAVVGSAVIAVGRFVWEVPTAVYVGTAILVGASFWNLWLKRPIRAPLVRIRINANKGEAT